MESVLKHTELKIDKSNWKLVKFGDVVAEPKETCKDIESEGIEHVVGLEHIDTGDLHLRKSATTEESTTFSKKFRKGDVLFGRRRAYLKKAGQADFDGICSGDITVFRAKNSLLPELLPFIVNNDKFFDFAVKHSAGGLSPRVKFKDLANYEFLLPPKAEQARLAELLWAMDEVIEKDKVVLERLNNYFLSKLNSLFWDQKAASQKTKFGSIPFHWQLFRLEEVSKKIGDGIHSTPHYVQDSNFRFINGNNIINREIQFNDRTQFVSEQEYSKYNLKLEKGTILMSINGTIGNLGFYNGEDVVLGKSVAYISPSKNTLYNDYLFFLLQTKKTQDFYNRELTGTTISNLSLKSIRNTPVPLAPYKEQIEIANSARQLVDLLTKAKTKLALSQTLQKSLINQVF